ncbi:MAG: HAD hydrolase family protein [Planctomycetota bacterium]|nr:HAD hydrolase family protein [Planctomycetota bacterium]
MDPETAGGIRLLCLDVDGVMTDGRIVYDEHGVESKRFHVRDGLAIKLWRDAGHEVAIISSRSSEAVTRRAAELGVQHVHQGCRDKLTALESVSSATGIDLRHAAAMGDDLPDLPMLHAVALPIAVADAATEVRTAAALVTDTPGGHGAVREVIETLLQAQGCWDDLLSRWQTARQEG